MTENIDTVVIGGGVMGSAAAWHLARRGIDVALLERFEPGHHNGASHGASRIFRMSYPDPVHIALAHEAREQWRLLEDLTSNTILTTTGGVEHGRGAYLDELADALAVAGIGRTWMTPEEAGERWPGIRFDTRALFHPDSGRLHADRAVSSFQQSAEKHGALVRHSTQVISIDVLGDDAVLVHTNDETFRARRAVVTVNAWSAKLLGSIIALPKLRVTQEQPAHFAPIAGEADWPSFGHLFAEDSADAAMFFGGIYGLATPGEGIKVGFHGVGPEVDPDQRDFTPEPQQLLALREYARTWLPGVDADSFTPISCTYTTTPDSIFILDRQGPVVVGAGFSGHGFKFAPAIGRVLADLALDGAKPDTRFAFAR